MKVRVFRVRYRTLGNHVHIRVFAGEDFDHLAFCGKLVMRPEEWDTFREFGERNAPRYGKLLEFVEEQGEQAREGERLLGSSEVLESVIGKFKYLAGERGQHGMTGMALSIGAFVGRQAISTVQTALQEITTHDA